jgi:serine/threonine-protein kinase
MGPSSEGRANGATAVTLTPSSNVSAGAELAPGQMVGEYQVERLLGEGGMGRVYAAIHPLIAKRAAIKVLRPELSHDPATVERFVREARSVNQIGHPNIVDIFAFGTLPDARHYFVMEWLQGESLATRLARGPLPLALAVDVLDAIASALAAAHAAGIVHRDLKPDNVFLVGAAPIVKLLDFGIAKLLGTDAGIDQTATGALIGTPAYMSPEQARGELVDTRSDLYALGTLAFEVLTGEMVFQANSAAEIVARHLFEPARHVRELRPVVPGALDALITALLAKEMTARPSLAEVRATLARVRAEAQLPAHARRSRRFATVAASAVAATAVGVAIVVAAWPSSSPVPLIPAPIAATPPTTLVPTAIAPATPTAAITQPAGSATTATAAAATGSAASSRGSASPAEPRPHDVRSTPSHVVHHPPAETGPNPGDPDAPL